MNDDAPPIDQDHWATIFVALDNGDLVEDVQPEPLDGGDEEWAARLLRSITTLETAARGIQWFRTEHVEAARNAAAEFRAHDFEVLTREASNRREALKAWAIARRMATGTKSFQFPAGKITTTGGTKWMWPDDSTGLVAELESAGRADLVRVRKEVAKDLLKAAALVKDGRVLVDGQVIDGVTVEDRPITAEVVL